MNAKVRRARSSDKEELMRFIKDIWGGHDYLPYVWDEWLRDPAGRMFVVEVDGIPVGMNRVRFLEDGTAWFEGVRIHPKFRGKGLASLLGENSMKVANARGIKTFRLTSGSHNHSAHRQVARIKFAEKSRFSVYRPRKGTKFRPQEGVRQAEWKDRATVERLLAESDEFRLGRGVFWDNFTAVSLTPRVIDDLLRRGSIWTADDAVAIFRVGKEGNETWKQVCFVGGAKEGVLPLVRQVLSLPAEGKNFRRFVFVPQGSPIIGALKQAGFEREFSMILFERSAKG
jgi:GNAT superfamily N-acetyltransferase